MTESKTTKKHLSNAEYVRELKIKYVHSADRVALEYNERLESIAKLLEDSACQTER